MALVDFFGAKQAKHDGFHLNAIRFNEVKDHTFLVVVVAVQKSNEGVYPRDHQRFFDPTVQNAVPVVQKGIEYVLQNPDYQQLCENSRTKALQHYSEKVVAEKHKDLYESIKNKEAV